MFKDRNDAGRKLAEKLSAYRGQNAVVLALPRGGVVPGYEIAKILGLPLDIVVVRKVGYPGNPEYALCAVDETGTRLCSEVAADVDPTLLAEETGRQQQEAKRRIAAYRGNRKPERITVAVPVAPPEAMHALRKEGADDIIVLEPPEVFLGAVGAHYIRFEQVEDSEVIRLLNTL